MKTLVMLAIGLVSTIGAFAGTPGTPQVPDGGASVLLLGIGVAVVGLARKFRR